MNNVKKAYIVLSFRGIIPCASARRINEQIKYFDTFSIYDGFELNRQDKI